MKNTADFLDALRIKLQLPSDGRLADHLGMHRQHVSRYRTLGGTFDDEMSMRVADILETDPAYVVACMHHQRAKREDEKKLWQRIATLTAGVSAALLVAWLAPFPAGSEFGLMAASMSLSNVYYVKSKKKVLPLSFHGQSPHFNLHTGATLKTIALFTVLIICVFGIITAMARPDILQTKYSEIRAPIDQYFAEKNFKAWKAAKDTERAAWSLKLKLHADCGAPKTAIRELECRNKIQLHAKAFEQNWLIKLNSGWKPDGVSN